MMRYFLFAGLISGLLLSAAAAADEGVTDSPDNAVQTDRRLIHGTWQVTALTVNGHRAKPEDAQRITVVNGDDGSWSIRSAGQVISRGASSFDPLKTPKTIDFTPTAGGGQGERFLGIYQLGKNTRKLCFAPAGKARPAQFSSTAENQQILVHFQRLPKADGGTASEQP